MRGDIDCVDARIDIGVETHNIDVGDKKLAVVFPRWGIRPGVL